HLPRAQAHHRRARQARRMTVGLRHSALSACLALGVADLVFLNARVLPRALGRGLPVPASVEAGPPAPSFAPASAPLPVAEPSPAAPPLPAAAASAPPPADSAAPVAQVTFETGVHRLDHRARQAIDALAARLVRSRGVT